MKIRPFLWPVIVDRIPYGIPLTTQHTSYGYPGYLRCAKLPNTGANIRFMIPVPEAALLPPAPLTSELITELEYYTQIQDYIRAEAHIIYRLSGVSQTSSFLQNHNCDYQELNSVYKYWQPGFDAGYFLCPNKEDMVMPISRNGKAFYTPEQYQEAKYNSNALEYALSRGYDLIRQNNYYIMRDHDSMVFTPQGSWFWNSRGVHGGALEFQMYYEGKTITEAVLTLAGERDLVQSKQGVPEQFPPQGFHNSKSEMETKHFRLPSKAEDYRNLFRYLCVERCLEKDVVQEMIRQRRVYQSDVRILGKYGVSNAVFVYQNSSGEPVGAFQRGMMPTKPGQQPYKRDSPGSDKQFGWMLTSPHHPATEVRVFEGAIDAASDASLAAMKEGQTWQDIPVDRLSLEGLGYQPLETYLREHPNVRKVTLMLDGDEPGRRAAQNISDKLFAQGYEVNNMIPALDKKDWNEVLIETRLIEEEQQSVKQQADVPGCEECEL